MFFIERKSEKIQSTGKESFFILIHKNLSYFHISYQTPMNFFYLSIFLPFNFWFFKFLSTLPNNILYFDQSQNFNLEYWKCRFSNNNINLWQIRFLSTLLIQQYFILINLLYIFPYINTLFWFIFFSLKLWLYIEFLFICDTKITWRRVAPSFEVEKRSEEKNNLHLLGGADFVFSSHFHDNIGILLA